MPTSKSIEKALSLIKGDDASSVLGLRVGTHTDVQPGQYIPRADAQSPPELFVRGLSQNTTYMVVSVDVDAPFPSFGVLGPILHWIQPGLQPAPSESGTDAYALKITAPCVANYIGPAPPPGSSPHRYIFMLYEQPGGFDGAKYAPPGGKELGTMSRLRYDLDSWGEQVKLGPPVAANYFTSN
ncbi:hypothetical protein VUR80DRAFT_5951 [Thermomyces stellatus]